jgi:hypothetical protein
MVPGNRFRTATNSGLFSSLAQLSQQFLEIGFICPKFIALSINVGLDCTHEHSFLSLKRASKDCSLRHSASFAA